MTTQPKPWNDCKKNKDVVLARGLKAVIREEPIGEDGTVHEVTSNVMHYLTQLDKVCSFIRIW